jgi:hypothetical protein
MALESALWGRLKTGAKALRAIGYKIDLQRIENAATSGHPDVEGCINGSQIWIENKSEARPKRIETPIRPKLRESQSIWHKTRVAAGCRCNWVLLQVGDGRDASLYLIRGCHYDRIKSISEPDLELLSAIPPSASPADALIVASRGW